MNLSFILSSISSEVFQLYSVWQIWLLYSLHMIAKTLKIFVENLLNIKTVFMIDPFSSFSSTLVFPDAAKKIHGVILLTAADPKGDLTRNLKFVIFQWRFNFFQFNVIVKTRLVVYQLAMIIKYIKNMINWKDALFKKYIHESINSAIQYYNFVNKL